MQLQRPLGITRGKRAHHLGHLARRHIGGHADDTLGTDAHEGQRQGIIAADDLELRSASRPQLADAVARTPCLLDADDILELRRQALDGVDPDLDATATRNAVKQDGQPGGPGDGREVLIHAFLRGLVVVRGHLERTIHTELLGLLGQEDGLLRGIATGTRQHRQLAARKLHGQLDHLQVFVIIECRGLTGGSHGHDPIHPALDLGADQFLKGRFVQFSIAKRGDQCRESASKHSQGRKNAGNRAVLEGCFRPEAIPA